MRKAGQIQMTVQHLENVLKIPHNSHIRDIKVDYLRNIISLLVEGGTWLPDVPEGSEPPVISWEEPKDPSY